MGTTARQARLARAHDNCQYVRDELAQRLPAYWALLDAVTFAMNRERVAGYPPALRDHAFGRMLCRLIDGEPVLAARSRGYAAECAADASEAIRDGDLTDARALLNAALTHLDARQLRMAGRP